MAAPDLTKIIPPSDINTEERQAIFQNIFTRLAVYRHERYLFALAEDMASDDTARKEKFEHDLGEWSEALVVNAWDACQLEGECPKLGPEPDTATRNLPALPSDTQHLQRTINSTLLLHLTSTKHYSAHTRVFLFALSPPLKPFEHAIISTLKDPDKALKDAEKHAKEKHAEGNKTLRRIGIGAGALAGGVIIGVTGGLAAPLVGAGVGSLLGVFGVGGTAAGLVTTGLASSSMVCGALFGAYGAKSSAGMVERYTAEVQDFEFIPVGSHKRESDSLGVKLCVTGWLNDRDDIVGPWTVLDTGPESDEIFALQWEIKALEQLSSAMVDLIKSHAVKYVRLEIIKRTVLSSLLAGLSPIALLKIGQIMDNPWMRAKALALKTGKVLAALLSQRAFGNRPVTLYGYSLGALVIYSALSHLATLPVTDTLPLIDSVYLFGLPASIDLNTWISIRRLVAGRVVNGYSKDDWLLAVLGRATSDGGLKGNFEIAGLKAVRVRGVENLEKNVGGHLGWRGNVGVCLEELGVEVDKEAVKKRAEEDKERVKSIEKDAEKVGEDEVGSGTKDKKKDHNDQKESNEKVGGKDHSDQKETDEKTEEKQNVDGKESMGKESGEEEKQAHESSSG